MTGVQTCALPILAGIYGVLIYLDSLVGIQYNGWIVTPIITVVAVSIWYSYNKGYKRYYQLLFVTTVIVNGILIAVVPSVREQINLVIASCIGAAGNQRVDVTYIILLLVIDIMFFIFIFECLTNSHMILYFLTTLLLVLSPLVGVQSNPFSVLLLLIFQILFWLVHATCAEKRSLVFEGVPYKRILNRTGVIMVVGITILYTMLYPIVQKYSDQLNDIVYKAEGEIFRTITTLSGTANRTITGNYINMGNTYRTGTPHLELVAVNPITEPVYLKGFGGAEYKIGRASCRERVYDLV